MSSVLAREKKFQFHKGTIKTPKTAEEIADYDISIP